MRDQLAHARHRQFIRRHLRRNVRKIVRHHAAWPRASAQLIFHTIKMRRTMFNKQRGFNHHAFMRKRGGVGRHGSRTRSANLRVVRAIGREANQFLYLIVVAWQ